MNGLMSLSTRPSSFRPTKEHLLLHSAALAFAKRAFKTVELVTDEHGIIIADRMRWEYDTFSLSLEHADRALCEIWSSGKLYAQLQQTEPYAHVDNDVLLFQSLPEEILTARVFAQSKDEPGFYLAHWAQEAMRTAGIDPGACAFNTGIVGGNDVAALHAYCREALEAMMKLKDHPEPHGISILAEQAVFGQFFRKHRIRVTEMIPMPLSAVASDFAGREFAHLWGNTKRDPRLLARVERRMRQEFPDSYEAFVRAMEHLATALARTTLSMSGRNYGYGYNSNQSSNFHQEIPDLQAVGCTQIDLDPKLDPNAPSACGPTACIVTCHNYGRFLHQCLASLVSQSLPFSQVIVVDDDSTDNTTEIVSQFPSVVYQWVSCHDFTDARKLGLALANSDTRFLLFVDADNWLDLDYHRRLRAAMHDPATGVAYSLIRSVDADGKFMYDRAEEFDYHRLRRNNFADACSLIRVEAYNQAGGWQKNVGGLTDWLLWLKITRNGWGMKLCKEAVLYYRRHGQNMNTLRGKAGKVTETLVNLTRNGMVVTIVSLFCGREWALSPWFESVMSLDWPKEGLRIVAVDNSCDLKFNSRLRRMLAMTRIPHTVIEDDCQIVHGVSASEFADDAGGRSRKAYFLSEHLARLYSLARTFVPRTDLVLCWEDDISIPSDGLSKLVEGLHQNRRAGVVSGVVSNRFANCLIAWTCRREKDGSITAHRHLQSPPSPGIYQQIDGSGFMATLFLSQVWDKIAFRPSPGWDRVKRPYYDFAAAQEVRRMDYQWLLAGSVRCKHHRADGGIDEV